MLCSSKRCREAPVIPFLFYSSFRVALFRRYFFKNQISLSAPLGFISAVNFLFTIAAKMNFIEYTLFNMFLKSSNKLFQRLW